MTIKKVKKANGKTVYRVFEYTGFTIDGKRDRICQTCDTLAAAKVAQAKIVAQREALRGRSGRITFGAYCERWYKPTMRSLAKSSRDTYERELRLRLLPAFQNVDIRDIDRRKIQAMIDDCNTEAVARKALGCLKTILNHAIADRLIVLNPAKSSYILPNKGRKRDEGTVITSFAKMRPIFDLVDEYGDESIELLATTGFLMGLRPEERYGLEWKDIDWTNNAVNIQRAYTAVSKGEGTHDLKEPKTENGYRAIPLTNAARKRLAKYRRNGKIVRVGAVITGANGKRISPSTAQKRWRRFYDWCRDNGHDDIPYVTLENMRHSFATSFLHAGGNVEDLAKILGHADISTTYRRYIKPSVDDLREGMQAIDQLAL